MENKKMLDGLQLLPRKNRNQLQCELLSQDQTTNLYFLVSYHHPMNLKENKYIVTRRTQKKNTIIIKETPNCTRINQPLWKYVEMSYNIFLLYFRVMYMIS